MTKARAGVAVKATVASKDDAANVIAQLTVEQNARAFNKSANANKKVQKFCEGEFTTPTIFKDNNFKTFVKETKKTFGLVGKNEMKSRLEQIIDAKIDEEVENKIAMFSKLPLSVAQKKKLQAAKNEYFEHLSSIVSKSKQMIKELI